MQSRTNGSFESTMVHGGTFKVYNLHMHFWNWNTLCETTINRYVHVRVALISEKTCENRSSRPEMLVAKII